MQIADSFRFRWQFGPLFFTILTACLICTNRLSWHILTTPLLTAFLISIPTSLLPKIIRTVVQIAIGETVVVVCLVDAYCQIYFKVPISPHIFSIISQTNLSEASEFLSTFTGPKVFFQWRIIGLLLVGVLFPLSYIPAVKNKIENCLLHLFPKGRHTCIVITVLLIICLVVELPATIRFLQFFRHRANPDFVESLIFRDYHQNTPTPLHRLAYSWQATNVSMRAMEMLRANTYGATIDSTSHCSPHIVLIIGESFNKHHSSLYGYTLATTPLQQQRMENGELFPFTDAVTPWNITSNAILHLFAVGPSDPDGTLAHRILFPILFQRAGYEVTFFSNQFRIKGVFSGATSVAGNFFLSDKEMSDSLFTYRNSRFSQKDMGIVRQLSEYYAEKTITPFTLDIIHLKGQHFDYSQRYPSEEAFFSVEDYADRNLDRQSMLTVMHYDNATRYNDRVLDSLLLFYESMEAIVVFIPDHGEEVYDDLPVQGRLFQKPDFYQARNEYEVPLWIWCSQSYSELHPDIVALIEDATGRPLMSDNIPQLLLYLADINSQWTSEEQNVLSTSYRKNRRIIGGEVDYDSIVTND